MFVCRRPTKFIQDHRDRPFFVTSRPMCPRPHQVADSYRQPYPTGRAARAASFYGMIANFDENLAA